MLSSKWGEFETVTDEKGRFKFLLLDGVYDLVVKRRYYTSVKERMAIDKSKSVDIEIKPEKSVYFPLDKGNYWTYNYNFNKSSYSGYITSREGTIKWTIKDKSTTDSLINYYIREEIKGISYRIYDGDDTTDVDTLNATNQFNIRVKKENQRLFIETNNWVPLKDITNGMRIYKVYPSYRGILAKIEDNRALKYIDMTLRFHKGIGLVKMEASTGGNTYYEYKLNLDWDNYQINH